ncbi:hypothetical protein DFP72DRAFT_844203 [Ephemerocybe angulata]|uniref:Uncharacterized protein n=1 Tax=Ephemerocybe angulata TaxID=980116 RepID=A0A8H6I8I6_9AGAR|nr:hypothetical protein DFP72DRAFT_844203 [Tulosesus angulatus]
MTQHSGQGQLPHLPRYTGLGTIFGARSDVLGARHCPVGVPIGTGDGSFGGGASYLSCCRDLRQGSRSWTPGEVQVASNLTKSIIEARTSDGVRSLSRTREGGLFKPGYLGWTYRERARPIKASTTAGFGTPSQGTPAWYYNGAGLDTGFPLTPEGRRNWALQSIIVAHWNSDKFMGFSQGHGASDSSCIPEQSGLRRERAKRDEGASVAAATATRAAACRGMTAGTATAPIGTAARAAGGVVGREVAPRLVGVGRSVQARDEVVVVVGLGRGSRDNRGRGSGVGVGIQVEESGDGLEGSVVRAWASKPRPGQAKPKITKPGQAQAHIWCGLSLGLGLASKYARPKPTMSREIDKIIYILIIAHRLECTNDNRRLTVQFPCMAIKINSYVKAQAKPKPKVKAKPRPAKARPKPRASGQAQAQTTLLEGAEAGWVIASPAAGAVPVVAFELGDTTNFEGLDAEGLEMDAEGTHASLRRGEGPDADTPDDLRAAALRDADGGGGDGVRDPLDDAVGERRPSSRNRNGSSSREKGRAA